MGERLADILVISLMVALALAWLLFQPVPSPCQATCRQAGYIQGEDIEDELGQCFCEGSYPNPRPIRRMPVDPRLVGASREAP